MPGFPKHEKAVELAKMCIGKHEEPMGSNTGPFVKDCQRFTWFGGCDPKTLKAPAIPKTTRWPWCVAFALRNLVLGGLSVPYRGAGAYDYLNWAIKNSWSVPRSLVIPGDPVVFNIGEGHMAMFLNFNENTVVTVDGNVGDSVKLCERSLSLVRGFIHIPEAHVVQPPRPKVFEVVTSESGHKQIYVSGATAIGKKMAQILGHHPEGVLIREKKK